LGWYELEGWHDCSIMIETYYALNLAKTSFGSVNFRHIGRIQWCLFIAVISP
jgi:hypothetical protein